MATYIRKTLKAAKNRMLAELSQKIDTIDSRLEGHIHETRAITYPEPSHIMPVSDKEIVAKIFSGLKMSLDPRDIAVAPHLALDRIWEESITKAWLGVLKNKGVVFDVGANFGYFGVIAAQRMEQKGSKVVLFEPNPNLLPYVEKTISMNWLHQSCMVENVGVSQNNGKATLTILKDYLGCSSMHSLEHLGTYLDDKMTLEAQEVIEVPTVALDDYCNEKDIKNVDLIKLDIEGFEDKAYLGMRRVVKSSKSLILFVEFTKESYDKPKVFYETMLSDFGHVYTISDEGQLISPRVNTYDNVVADTEDWVMLVFSKVPLEKKN